MYGLSVGDGGRGRTGYREGGGQGGAGVELFRDAVSWVAHGGKGEEGDRGMSTAVHAVALP